MTLLAEDVFADDVAAQLERITLASSVSAKMSRLDAFPCAQPRCGRWLSFEDSEREHAECVFTMH